MKPSLESLVALCKVADRALVAAHCVRLDERYFDAFPPEAVAAHLDALALVTPAHPIEVRLDARADGLWVCTVLAFDYPAEFSLIAGVLTGMGFSIDTGLVFTWRPAPPEAPPPRTASGRRRVVSQDPLRRRRIVDQVVGRATFDGAAADWQAAVCARLRAVIGLLERGDAGANAEARHHVNEAVARRLGEAAVKELPLLYPMQIEFPGGHAPYTTLRIVSQDTPAFLYALSTALALQHLSIEQVRIHTGREGRIEDEVDVLDDAGQPIDDPARRDQIALAILLTKQFTYFLGQAPDPYTALCRFDQLLDDVLKLPARGQWVDWLSRPRALQDLARLLGAGDYLWEDFIRLQYEALRPILEPHVEGRSFALNAADVGPRLRAALADGEVTTVGQLRRLNEFKDREIFAIDLDAILNARHDVRQLAEPLTRLAEAVVTTASSLVYSELVSRHGRPRTVAGIEARYAICGLGKFGGVALGYASDIELLFVYDDNGRTDGAQPMDNAEFFGALARETALSVVAKREGIFRVDLRLRPYGASGPWACSLESFCRYYGPGGAAHAIERMALVRLRAVGGDAELGRQVERLRDEFLYAAQAINVAELREARARQLAGKTRPGVANAKFSPGGLVDIEYDVQLLQVIHGITRPALRTPRIHMALEALAAAGLMAPGESAQLLRAYDFLRHLINGLRMLRGSALDLDLPPADAVEFAHLARRMGYDGGVGLEPGNQLHVDFERETAVVRAFVERHFGRDSLPGKGADGSLADLVLSDAPSGALREKILRRAGFADPAHAYDNLRRLAGTDERRDCFAGLVVLAGDLLARVPDPDMALNNWERLAAVFDDPKGHFERLLAQPKRLALLLDMLAGSQFLADTLVRVPEFFEWATDPRNLQSARTRDALERDLAGFLERFTGHAGALDAVRRFRRRELVRIGARDLCMHAPLSEVTGDLARLADVVTDAVLRQALDGGVGPGPGVGFCVLAFGKLGGGELNYSSDVDLLGLYDDRATTPADADAAADGAERLMRHLVHELSAHTAEGYAYRVDLRLRPYGPAGHAAYGLRALVDYYQHHAELWEIQALLKVRPAAGDLSLGMAFCDAVRPLFLIRRDHAEIIRTVTKLRHRRVQKLRAQEDDVKTGVGGIRDVEFLTQALQLMHAPGHPDILGGNTLDALAALARAGVLDVGAARQLAEDYAFLRRIEHALQILEDRQIHALPESDAALTALAKRVLGVSADAPVLRAALDACQHRVRAAYRAGLASQGG
ncbi:MAG: glutamate-ammonia-ligase adenylyltransferase [bacterium]